MKIRTWHIWAIPLTLAMFAGDAVYAYYRSHEAVSLPPENRRTFVRVIAAIDSTPSMDPAAVAEAKQIVSRRIIPSVGPGDRLTCIAVGPDYGLTNQVFGATWEDQVPQFSTADRKRVLDVVHRYRAKPLDSTATADIRDLSMELRPKWPGVAAKHNDWAGRVDSMGRPKSDGTSLRAMLEGIRAEVEDGVQPDEDLWIFLVSDLLEDPPVGARPVPPLKGGSFAGAHFVLVYPHESEHADWNKVKAYWHDQLDGEDITIVPFSRALSESVLLPSGPFEGLRFVDAQPPFAYIRPAIIPQVSVLLLFIILFVIDQFVARNVSSRAAPAA